MARSQRSRRLCIEQVESRLALAARPALTVGNVDVTEGDSGTKTALVAVSLSAPTTSTVTVYYRTAAGTAVSGSDYSNIGSTKLTFRPGETSKNLSVSIKGDTLVENTEEFYITLSSAKNASIAKSKGVVKVLDNDAVIPPTPPPTPPTPPTPPPTTQTYGKTGAMGPQAGVTAPAGAIIVSTSQTTAQIQSTINNAPSNAVIFFRAGTYRDLMISPKSGQQYIGEQGAILTSATKTAAFRDTASNVTLRNLVVDGYVPAYQAGSVAAGSNWTIDNLEVRNSAMGGITLGSGSVLTDSYIHHNLQIGLKAEGSNIVVRNNEVAFNNYTNAYDVYWEAGGSKFFNTSNVLIEYNTFHDNTGQGIWLDYNNRDGIVRNNWSYGHTLSGIFHEIGGKLLIEYNLAENNGVGYNDPGWLQGAGICIDSSSDVTVRNNIVRNNANGISIIATSRDSGLHVPKNIVVEYNTITMNKGRTGVVWDYEAASTPWNTVFFNYNTYTLSGGAGFAWEAPWSNVVKTWSQWRAAGNDVNGTLK